MADKHEQPSLDAPFLREFEPYNPVSSVHDYSVPTSIKADAGQKSTTVETSAEPVALQNEHSARRMKVIALLIVFFVCIIAFSAALWKWCKLNTKDKSSELPLSVYTWPPKSPSKAISSHFISKVYDVYASNGNNINMLTQDTSSFKTIEFLVLGGTVYDSPTFLISLIDKWKLSPNSSDENDVFKQNFVFPYINYKVTFIFTQLATLIHNPGQITAIPNWIFLLGNGITEYIPAKYSGYNAQPKRMSAIIDGNSKGSEIGNTILNNFKPFFEHVYVANTMQSSKSVYELLDEYLISQIFPMPKAQ